MMSYLLVFSAFSVFLIILLFGNKIKKLSNYRRCMINRMIPALMIGFIYFAGDAVSMLQMKDAISGIISGVCIFCLSSMGLAFTMNITGFEPLPVSMSFVKKEGRARQILMMLFFSVVIVAFVFIINLFISQGWRIIFHEQSKSAQALGLLPIKNKFLAFPSLLAAAGIAEEGVFRLFFQSLFWKLFKNPWIAIALSSFCFALYHLSPMDIMYKVYWQYPLTQFTTVFLSGLVFGYFYKKQGFETVVLGHTLFDYICFVL